MRDLLDQGSQRPLTVSELTASIKSTLEDGFDELEVEGEVSNFTAHRSGHWYFTLKDAGAELSAVMFRNRNQRSHRPSAGDRVIALGRVSVYAPRGRYQLICERLRPAGEGELWRRYLALKDKLAAEGLFEEERKRPLPEIPEAIGVVTSPEAAALQDMLRIVRERNPALRVVLMPVAVQGEGAAAQIAEGIAALNRVEGLELIVIGRGGGSLEDLWAFNEEVVARAVVASRLPVVSAVGHESDVLISDLAADLRAPTPTAAIEWIVPDREELAQKLITLRERMHDTVRDRIAGKRKDLEVARLKLVDPRRRIADQRLALEERLHRLERLGAARLDGARRRLVELGVRLGERSPAATVSRSRDRLCAGGRALGSATRASLAAARARHHALSGRLVALGPGAVLERGYAIARRSTDGAVLRDSGEVAPGDEIDVRLARGELGARVEKTGD